MKVTENHLRLVKDNFSFKVMVEGVERGKGGEKLEPFPPRTESCIEIKINLNFCFHTSLWCLKSFLKGLVKIKIGGNFLSTSRIGMGRIKFKISNLFLSFT